jgi:hypothetical protein
MTRPRRGNWPDLLQSIVDAEHLARGLDDRTRSDLLAYVSGVLNGVMDGRVGLAAAATTVRAWRPLEGPGRPQMT